jgi:hypothetical protein
MSDLERRLRAAMLAAAEQPPAGLMQGIRRRHRRHVRRVGSACVAALAAVAIAAPPVVHALRADQAPQDQPARPALAVPTPAPASSVPSAVPTTPSANDCQPSVGALASNWRDGSLRAGPVWFVYDRLQGYVHLGSSAGAPPGAQRGGKLEVGVMVVEVNYGYRAVLKVAPIARSYFRFLDGFTNGSGPYPLRDGLNTLTLAACPRGAPPGDNGRVSDFYLGFIIKRGSEAPVDIWTSASARPIRVIFTCPQRGCHT